MVTVKSDFIKYGVVNEAPLEKKSQSVRGNGREPYPKNPYYS